MLAPLNAAPIPSAACDRIQSSSVKQINSASPRGGFLTTVLHVSQTIATHYDNLKVKRDAPVGVIKASYRKLSQKYHPDRNPDPGALEIMKLINQAWDVLSDPERRARHDRAIAALERRTSPQRAAPQSRAAANAPPVHKVSFLDQDWIRVALMLALLFVLLFAVFQLARPDGDDEPDADAVAVAQPAPEQPHFPAEPSDRLPHGYLTSSAQDSSPGIAVVEIDNKAGLHDAEVRLFRNGRAARSMYVHHGQRFVVEDLAAGTYVLKYKVIADGKVLAYQERELFQPQRDKFIKLKVRLFDGSARPIAADQF